LFVNSSPSTASPLSKVSDATSDLFDQSALSTLAQQLVEAAKRAGADAADAVAVRGVSQGVEVRDGRVEESERSEGDDVGLRVLVGQRQAVVSTNDVSGDGVAKLAERAVAMTNMSVSPILRCWRANSPISICSTAKFPRPANWSAAPVKPRLRHWRSRA
jgi:PmbA protein